MNATERRFAGELSRLCAAKEIDEFEFHPKLPTLLGGIKYTPDFKVWKHFRTNSNLGQTARWIYEIKTYWYLKTGRKVIGRWRETEKQFKTAADIFRWIKFVRAVWDARKKTWTCHQFIPGTGWKKCGVLP